LIGSVSQGKCKTALWVSVCLGILKGIVAPYTRVYPKVSGLSR